MYGLDLLEGYKIWCHYEDNIDVEKIAKIKGKIIALYEESGLLFDGEKFTIIGKPYIEFKN